MARKVFLHIGAPLTPGTALQGALTRHRRRLARAGIFYPPSHLGHDGGHRDAVLDVLDLTADHTVAPGSWDRLAEHVRDWRMGTAVISHELLAAATERQVDRMVTSLGSAQVHVVYVAQDLGRQLPQAWQEWVYGGGTTPFATYATHVAQRDRHRAARAFRRHHDLEPVLSTWTTRVPPERVHVVAAARGDRAVQKTWARFATTVGIDPERFTVNPGATDGLGSLVGTEVVRLLNAAGDKHGAVDRSRHRRVVEHVRAVPGAAPRLPEELRAAVTAEAERTMAGVRSNGWRLVGALDELMPQDDAFTTDPTQVTPSADQLVRTQTAVLLSLSSKDKTARGPADLRRRALRVLRERVRR